MESGEWHTVNIYYAQMIEWQSLPQTAGLNCPNLLSQVTASSHNCCLAVYPAALKPTDVTLAGTPNHWVPVKSCSLVKQNGDTGTSAGTPTQTSTKTPDTLSLSNTRTPQQHHSPCQTSGLQERSVLVAAQRGRRPCEGVYSFHCQCRVTLDRGHPRALRRSLQTAFDNKENQ